MGHGGPGASAPARPLLTRVADWVARPGSSPHDTKHNGSVYQSHDSFHSPNSLPFPSPPPPNIDPRYAATAATAWRLSHPLIYRF